MNLINSSNFEPKLILDFIFASIKSLIKSIKPSLIKSLNLISSSNFGKIRFQPWNLFKLSFSSHLVKIPQSDYFTSNLVYYSSKAYLFVSQKYFWIFLIKKTFKFYKTNFGGLKLGYDNSFIY